MTDLPVRAPQTPVRTPDSAIRSLRRALVHLDDERQALAEAGDVDNLARGLSDLDLVIGDLRAIERAGRANVAALMDAEWESLGKRGRPRKEIPNLGMVEVWGGSERKNWRSQDLLHTLILGALVNEDGEWIDFPDRAEMVEAIYAKLEAALPVTGSLSWKVGQHGKGTGLRGQGIEPSDYCEEVEAPRLAKIPKQAKEA